MSLRSDRPSPLFPRWIVLILLTVLAMSATPVLAQPGLPDSAAWGNRGQAAINALGRDLPATAAKYGMAPQKLRALLLEDPNLWVDSGGHLMFLDEFVPESEPRGRKPDRFNAPLPTGPFPYSESFQLHSLPGATKVIYLDFDGHNTTGTLWNNGRTDPIVSAPFDLDGNPSNWSNAELDRIQYIWQRVAEDFMPYGVNVTTQDPGIENLRNSGGGDALYGQRVVISPTNWYSQNAGGVAYIGSFNWSTDTPCYAFTAQLANGEKYIAEAVSHEAGHTLGLYHDGTTQGVTYYEGHGNWAPIMGVGYYREITQWSKGEYANANQLQDDLVVMTGYGFGFRPDDHANNIAGASALAVTNATSVSGAGIIGSRTDRDYFSFLTGAGAISLTANPAPRSPNLDILAELYNASGTLLASSDPSGLSAAINVSVAAGTYYLAIDGVGVGTPSTGYSDYASLGQYTIGGTIVDPGALQAPTAVASAVPTSGAAPLAVAFSSSGSSDPDGTIVSYAWDFGDGNTSTLPNPGHTYLGRGTYTAQLTVTDNHNLTGTDSVSIVVTAPPAAPTGLTAAAVSASRIDLSWTDNANNEDGFHIHRSLDNSNWTQVATPGANVTAYSDLNLSPSTIYFYRVRAHNVDGTSAWSNTASATTHNPPPFTDHLATADLPGAGTLAGSYLDTHVNDGVAESVTETVSGGKPSSRYSFLEHVWTIPVTPGFAVTLYANTWAPQSSDGDTFRFAYSTDNARFTDMFLVSATGDGTFASFSLPAQSNGTLYVRVTDTNRAPGSTAVDTVHVDQLYVRTAGQAPSPPAAPTSLVATAVSFSQINLTWTDNASTESGFRVERSPDGGTWSEIATTGENVTAYSDSGLNPGTTRHYRVRAFNAGGNSAYSNVATATTQQAQVIHVSDLDGSAVTAPKSRWDAAVTIAVHDQNHVAVSGVVVTGTWGNGGTGTGTCTTAANGTCSITNSGLKSNVLSVSFTVTGLSRAGYSYDALLNHDPDGDSNGTAVTVNQP